MARRNASGKTWRQHAAPYLSKALREASRTWKPKAQRANKAKLVRLRAQREKINNAIRTEVQKG